MSEQQRLAALSASKDPLEFWGNEQPKCPHCGADYDISSNDAWGLYTEGEHEVECPACDLEFTVSTRVSFKFNTDEQDGGKA